MNKKLIAIIILVMVIVLAGLYHYKSGDLFGGYLNKDVQPESKGFGFDEGEPESKGFGFDEGEPESKGFGFDEENIDSKK